MLEKVLTFKECLLSWGAYFKTTVYITRVLQYLANARKLLFI